MLYKDVQIPRPERWSVPFDESMSEASVDRILEMAPFAHMDAERFPAVCSLRGILRNDARIRSFRSGDLVVREREYGNSAFLVLAGTVRVTLDPLPQSLLGEEKPRRASFWSTLRSFLFQSKIAEYRAVDRNLAVGQAQVRADLSGVFLQDVPGILNEYRTLQLSPGEFFGEVAALARTPRSANVLADSTTELLEIRWQGLRDLMRYDHALRDHIHTLYRKNSLAAHLRQTPFLQKLDETQLEILVNQTSFETYGDFEWNRPYKQLSGATVSERIDAEPVIAIEGNAPNGLVLVRNGFARLSQRYGNGHRTCSYLGKGETFGLAELVHQSTTGERAPLQYSLRSVGYVDVLRIPTELVEQHVLPQLDAGQIERLRNSYRLRTGEVSDASNCSEPSPTSARDQSLRSMLRGTPHKLPANRSVASDASGSTMGLETGMLEFIVENRLMNGSQAMLINLDRCTRCDDCVRACADTHDNNPRFVRTGPVFGHSMFASACMHCADPVCMIGCPTGAIRRDEQSGSVTINDGTCIGCSTCANSCPYQAIRMVEIRDERGRFVVDQSTQLPIARATKCDLCSGLLGGPACERACPHDALVRIDLRQPDDLAEWLAR